MSRETRYIRSCSKSPVYPKAPRGPRVSFEQVEALVDFMEYNRELACGYLNTTAGRYKAHQKWETVANSLNTMMGAQKDGKQWSAYWSNFKNKLKGRVRKLRAMANGEQIQTTTLSDIDRKALAILGPRYDIGQLNLMNVQVEVDPFLEDECLLLLTNDGASIPDSPPEASPEAAPRAASTPARAPVDDPRSRSPANLNQSDRKRRYHVPRASRRAPPPSDTSLALARVAAAVEALAAAQAQHVAAAREGAAALRAAAAALQTVAAAADNMMRRLEAPTPRGPNDAGLTQEHVKNETS